MRDLGPHAAFILASYGAVTLVLGALIGWLIHDGRRQQRLLDALQERGITRRSARAKTGDRKSP